MLPAAMMNDEFMSALFNVRMVYFAAFTLDMGLLGLAKNESALDEDDE